MGDFKTNRLSLSSVLMTNPDLADTTTALYQDFDMIRIFDPLLVEVEHVVNFAVLEHVMRGLCTEEDMNRYWTSLPAGLAGKLSAVVGSNSEISHLAVHKVAEVVSLADLHELAPLPAHVTLFESSEDGLIKTIREPEDLGRWAKVACLQGNGVLALLYCPEATFLDGFDPVSGETTEPLVTQELLHSLEDSLFYVQVRQSASVQTKPPRKRQEAQSKQPKFTILDSFSYLLKPHLQRKSPAEPAKDEFFAQPTLKSSRTMLTASPIQSSRPDSPPIQPSPIQLSKPDAHPQKQWQSSVQTLQEIEILPEPLPPPRITLLHREKQRKPVGLDRELIQPKDPEWAPYERKAIKLSREDCSLEGNCSIS